ncbi:MAG TPA: hypothetical protein VKI61_02850 [Chitinophagaceae bacterium]|jgi:hypothetical protein|nr:hypothetical protein [Chitinophagaceae bacterium]
MILSQMAISSVKMKNKMFYFGKSSPLHGGARVTLQAQWKIVENYQYCKLLETGEFKMKQNAVRSF